MASADARRILWPVFLSTGLWSASISVVSTPLPYRFLQLHISVFDYGLTLSAFALGTLVAETPWGIVAFRLGTPARILGLGAVVLGATAALSVARDFGTFAIAEGVLGAFGVFTVPLLRWIALTAGGPGTAGSGTGRLGAFFGAGLAVGAALGPSLFVTLGFTSVVVASVVLYAVGIVVLMRLPWKEAALPRAPQGFGRNMRAVLTPGFLWVATLVVLDFVATSFTTNFFQLYSVELFGGSDAAAGYVLAAVRIITLIASFALGTLVDRWGAARSLPSGFGLLVAGGLGTWFAPSYPVMVVATLVFAAGLGWLSAALLPMALAPIPTAQQGTAIGLFGSFEDLGLLIGPAALGASWTTLGPSSIFPLVVGTCLGGLILALVSRPTRRPSGVQTAAPVSPVGPVR